jgi:hypothetical protein
MTQLQQLIEIVEAMISNGGTEDDLPAVIQHIKQLSKEQPISSVEKMAEERYPLVHPDIDDYENDKCVSLRYAFIEGYKAAPNHLEELEKWVKENCVRMPDTNMVLINIDDFITKFKNTQKQMYAAKKKAYNNGWVSVDERMPEKNGTYLVYTEGMFSLIAHYDVKSKFRLEPKFATHWMPLPPKPIKQ